MTVLTWDDLIAIPIMLRPSLNVGLLKLEASTGGMKVKVWSSPSKSYEVVLPRTVDLSSQGVPSQLYVEGVAASGAMRDVTLKLSYIYNTATLHADPVKLTVVEADLDIAGLTDAEEEDPGGDCIANSDDDNQNGIADGEETGTVYGENELKQVTLAILPANLNRGEVKLEATGGLGKYKLWESASKGTEVSLPRTWNLASQSPPPRFGSRASRPATASAISPSGCPTTWRGRPSTRTGRTLPCSTSARPAAGGC